MTEPARHSGRCLCGAVVYRVDGPMRDVIACHCSQCRRTSGHFAAYSQAATGDLVLTQAGGLAWYRSSASAERGFCKLCGSNLFWRPSDGDTTSIAAGTLDGATGLRIESHIFVADRGDYYEIRDDAPKHDAW